MKKLEAQATTRIRPWIAKNLPTCAIEVKHSRGKDFILTREVKDHQLWSLKAAQSRKGILYKIPDSSFGFLPFDMFQLKKVKAYIIVVYTKNFYVIPVEVFPFDKKQVYETDADAVAIKRGIISKI